MQHARDADNSLATRRIFSQSLL